MSPVRKHLVIHGTVQGVGYRWSMSQEARHLAIGGWVRNRRDGSVEAVVAGPAAAVEKIVRWAHRGPRGAEVVSVEVFPSEGTFSLFEQLPTA